MVISGLHTTSLGDSGSRIAFCHGLFGQGKNWTQIAKALAADGHRVTLVDLPNHGQSPWTATFSYVAMADAIAAQLRELGGSDPWTVVGHSMGGKAVMLLALRHPKLVERLVVVDISPVSYGGLTSFDEYIDGMQALDLDRLTSRSEADAAMQAAVPNKTIRSFLLQNLRRDGEHFRWQMNLDLLGSSLQHLGDWPVDEIPSGATYSGPVLWIAGAQSPYVKPDYRHAMEQHFPKARLVTIKDAGHWVHSEQPAVFLATLRAFLRAIPLVE